MKQKFYAGIGSRKTPTNILELMTKIAEKLDTKGFILRSGGAIGSDIAFEKGSNHKQIFLPFTPYNGKISQYVGASSEAYKLASTIHPTWNQLVASHKKLHARNIHQLLGWNIGQDKPSLFVVCWTPHGKIVGGTATAINMAKKIGIPVFNLANEKDKQRIITNLNI